MLELFARVASYYNIVSHELPLPISHYFVALFFFFFHGQNAKEGFVHNVVHAHIPDCGQSFKFSRFWVCFFWFELFLF